MHTTEQLFQHVVYFCVQAKSNMHLGGQKTIEKNLVHFRCKINIIFQNVIFRKMDIFVDVIFKPKFFHIQVKQR